jgi:RNA polymerase sigma factor (sigma-70 family)
LREREKVNMRTDEQLMEHYVLGDQCAFDALYARYEPVVRRVVRRSVYQTSAVDDCVQQTLMQFHLSRNSYRAGEKVRPWLCAIARNVCSDHGRRSRRRPEAPLDVDTLRDREPTLVPGELAQSCAPLLAALDELPALTQEIFRLHFVEDRPLVDIARALATHPGTVRVRLHRGCRALRDHVEQ